MPEILGIIIFMVTTVGGMGFLSFVMSGDSIRNIPKVGDTPKVSRKERKRLALEAAEQAEREPTPEELWKAAKQRQREIRAEDMADWDKRFREAEGKRELVALNPPAEKSQGACPKPGHTGFGARRVGNAIIAAWCGECEDEQRLEVLRKEIAEIEQFVGYSHEHQYTLFNSGAMRCVVCKKKQPNYEHEHKIKYVNGWRAACYECNVWVPKLDREYDDYGVHGLWNKETYDQAKKANDKW